MVKKFSASALCVLLPLLILISINGCAGPSAPGDAENRDGKRKSVSSLSDGTPVYDHYFKYYRGEGYDDGTALQAARMLASYCRIAADHGLSLSDDDASEARLEAGNFLEEIRASFAPAALDGELTYDELSALRYGFGFEDLADVFSAVRLSGLLRNHLLEAEIPRVTDDMIDAYIAANPAERSCAFLYAFVSSSREGAPGTGTQSGSSDEDEDKTDSADRSDMPDKAGGIGGKALQSLFEAVDSSDSMLDFIYEYSGDSERYENNIILSDELLLRIDGDEAKDSLRTRITGLEEGDKITINTAKGIYYLYCIESAGDAEAYDRDLIIYEIAQNNAEKLISSATAQLLKQEDTNGEH